MSDSLERWQAKIRILENGCWEWVGGKTSRGYGRFYVDGKLVYAHRWSYEHHKGKIRKGLWVCHTCDNPSCVNPDHLLARTPKWNQKDCVRKNRHRWRTDD